MTRILRLLLLSMVTAAVPCVWLAQARAGAAAGCALALAVALLVPLALGRLGLPVSGRLELLWLLPFALAWGLGEGLGLYARLSWWDKVPHAAGGAMAFALCRAWALPRLSASRPTLEALSVLGALAVGACWELGEYAADVWLGTATQAGNSDTMLDLIYDFLGALGALLAMRAQELAGTVRFRLLPARGRGA